MTKRRRRITYPDFDPALGDTEVTADEMARYLDIDSTKAARLSAATAPRPAVDLETDDAATADDTPRGGRQW